MSEGSVGVWVSLGFFSFCITNYLTRFLLPSSAQNTSQQSWKWKNVATSLVHSIITGIGSPLAFYHAPEMSDDLIRTFSPFCLHLVCFSIGYFIYDALDMIIFHRKKSTWELLVHHFFVILCFSIGVFSSQYVAYAGLSLMAEVNSVFLHSRQLFIICGESKSSARYKVNALLNVATFLFFRLLLLGWMTRWLTLNRDQIPLAAFTVGSMGLAVLVVMNIVLFCRILYADFFGILKLNNSGKARLKESAENGLEKEKSSAKSLHAEGGYVNSLFEEEQVDNKLSAD